jgi:putative phage-type endonuclease
MGVNPWSSTYALYLDKVGLADPQTESERMLWGRKLEPVVRTHYQEVTGRNLEPGVEMQRHGERAHLFANTDGRILPCEGHDTDGVYEGKTTSAYNKDEWRDEIPLYYQVQVQHYLYVLEAEWGSYGVLIGGQEFVWLDVPRNDRFIAAYLRKADEFWARVQTNDPPPMEGHDAERKALASLYPKHIDGKVVELDADAEEWAEKLDDARARASAAEKDKDRYTTLLRGAIGDALFGALPGGGGFKLALEHRKESVRKASSSRVLRKVKRIP